MLCTLLGVHNTYKSVGCREHMTDVVVQQLTTEQKICIKCNDYVKKLAVYKDCLAVQLPKSITIYQLSSGANADNMQYKPVAVIEQALECNLLVITADHLTLCQVQHGLIHRTYNSHTASVGAQLVLLQQSGPFCTHCCLFLCSTCPGLLRF